MALIKRRKKKRTLTKGTTKFVKHEKPLSAQEIGKFRTELQKQKTKAIASVNRKFNPINPSIGGATGSKKGVPFTKGINIRATLSVSKPRIVAEVNPRSAFKLRSRVGKVKLIKRIGEF